MITARNASRWFIVSQALKKVLIPMNLSWQVGDTRITRIEELLGPLFDPVQFFPAFDPEMLIEHKDWLFPNHVDARSGRIIASMHAWLIETPHHNILIDSCIGNDKDRTPYRNWHEMNTDWMSRLQSTGLSPADIDYVLCTHLHVDHVGWNTVWVNGTWQPTFANARYVIAEAELRHLEATLNAIDPGDEFALVNQKTYFDSIQPVLHQTDLVVHSQALISDRLNIDLTPGHTPGSLTIALSSQGEEARFCGDICHHPLQVYEPTMNSAYCELPEQAIATRLALLEDCAENGHLLMPAHFGPSHAAKVYRSGEAFNLSWH